MSPRRTLAWIVALALLTIAGPPIAGAHDAACPNEPALSPHVDSSHVDVYVLPEEGCTGAMAHDDRLDCQQAIAIDEPGSHVHVVDGQGCWTGAAVKGHNR